MASQEERDRIMAEYMSNVQDDDDDDDEEADFEPNGADDDNDEDDDSGEEEEAGVELKGSLHKNEEENRLVVAGLWKSLGGESRKFKLKSKPQNLPLHWDSSCPTVSATATSTAAGKADPRMRTIMFDGFFVSMEGDKIKEKDIRITFTSASASTSTNGHAGYKHGGHGKKDDDENSDSDGGKKVPSKLATVGKSDPDDDDDDDGGGGKMSFQKPVAHDRNGKPSFSTKPAATTTTTTTTTTSIPVKKSFGVFGQGTNEYGSFEFQGSLQGNELLCEKRYVNQGGSTSAGANSAANNNDSDDDEEDGGADQGVDYDELIALHQDAGMHVDDLRKRYRSSSGNGGQQDEERTTSSKKQCYQADLQDNDESDDDDEEFNGF